MSDRFFAGYTLIDPVPPELRAIDQQTHRSSAVGASPQNRLSDLLQRLEARALQGDRKQQDETLAALESAADGRAAILHLADPMTGPRWEALTTFLDGLVQVGQSLDGRRDDEAIAKLAEVILPDELGVARGVFAADNLALRDKFLAEVPALTGRELGERVGHSSSNPHATAARWKKAGDVFSVHHRGTEWFPAFQFRDDGRPLPVIRQVLRALPPHLTAWQRALWFASTNGWLGDRAPVDMLDDGDAIVAAAAHEGETVVG